MDVEKFGIRARISAPVIKQDDRALQSQPSHTASPAQPKLAGPLYNQIQLLMRERILAQEWREGKNLPTEVDLAREYSVSVGTMRKALDVLEDAKFIVRKQGLGTFVRDLNAIVGLRPTGWTVDGKASAERVIKVLAVTVGEASANDRAVLEVDQRTTINRIKLLSTIDHRGMVLDEYAIPEVAGFTPNGENGESLEQALQILERQATRFSDSFAVGAATQADVQLLRVAAGTPLLRIERIALNAKARPLFACVRTAHLGGAQYKVEVESR